MGGGGGQWSPSNLIFSFFSIVVYWFFIHCTILLDLCIEESINNSNVKILPNYKEATLLKLSTHDDNKKGKLWCDHLYALKLLYVMHTFSETRLLHSLLKLEDRDLHTKQCYLNTRSTGTTNAQLSKIT